LLCFDYDDDYYVFFFLQSQILLDSFENVFIVFVVPQEIAKAKEITAMLQTDR
jgi:hypothetical protein